MGVTPGEREHLISREARARGCAVEGLRKQVKRAGVLNLSDGRRLVKHGRWYVQVGAAS